MAGVRAQDINMKNKKLNAVHVWKQIEDVLAPRLKLTPVERVVYSHLVRHSRLEGKRRLHFSIRGVAQSTGLSHTPVRRSVRHLAGHGALRLVERSKAGHVVDVRLPEELPACRADRMGGAPVGRAMALEDMDFLQTPSRRHLLHVRERGLCFYCLREAAGRKRCLDHVVPRAQFGRNSYRNLVSCCVECNSAKGERYAKDFLRSLYRKGGLTKAEFFGRLRALKELAAGKLRPAFDAEKERSK
jgi:5-methylcytosine-specific restriction endonuclease McrA